jgi:prepilin-type N-terminal cleavage/methylation domain-containing protein
MEKLALDLKEQKGFTLIELIIVIIIVAVLSTTVVVQFQHLKSATDSTACKANQAVLSFALISYRGVNGTFAESIEDLAPYVAGDQIPECPSGGEYSIVDEEKIECSLPEHEQE